MLVGITFAVFLMVVRTIPYVNVLSLQSQMAATEATLSPLRQRLSQTEHIFRHRLSVFRIQLHFSLLSAVRGGIQKTMYRAKLKIRDTYNAFRG